MRTTPALHPALIERRGRGATDEAGAHERRKIPFVRASGGVGTGPGHARNAVLREMGLQLVR